MTHTTDYGPITEQWLREAGFRWHQMEGQPGKHWVLWLGNAIYDKQAFMGAEDLGIELAQSNPNRPEWNCWFRGDYSHRWSRFIHLRTMTLVRDLLRLIEALTGLPWNRDNVFYGSLATPEQAVHLREHALRLDRKLVEGSHPWNDAEQDATRGYPLNEHQELLRRKTR